MRSGCEEMQRLQRLPMLGGQVVGSGDQGHWVRFVAMSIAGSWTVDMCVASGRITATPPDEKAFCHVMCRCEFMSDPSRSRPSALVWGENRILETDLYFDSRVAVS